MYPQESQKLDVIAHLEELRRRIIISLAAIVIFSVFFFSQKDMLFSLVKAPLAGLVDELIFITPTEAFVSYVKVVLLSGFIFSFPFILYQVFKFLAPAIPKKTQVSILIWAFFSLLLFVLGISFSYFVAMPAALKFLLGFGQDLARPSISVGKYVSFFTVLILVGGMVFEIPVVIGFLSDIGLIKPKILRKSRRYAILIILIAAAIITPTQDIINMLIFALPMWLLFETGIMISGLIELRKRRKA